jgi:hypothetical protein
MQNDECDSTDFDELSRIELVEVRMQNEDAGPRIEDRESRIEN